MDLEEIVDIFDDDLDILELIEFGFPRRVNIRANHFDNLDNLTFFKRFRLYKETVLYLLQLIEHELEYTNDVNNSVSPINQLLTCLRFYASAGHLTTIADFSGMDVSTVSRIIKRVSTAIASLSHQFIKMSTPNNIINEQINFFNIAQFPRVVAVIDCTHVRIQSPGGEDGEVFRNRKSYFSINTQAVCNSDMKFCDIVARWPGSAHDSTIYNNSRIRARFEAGEFENSFLLGDGGYPLRSYFLTPVNNPRTHGQERYNETHIRTRNLVERVFGNWKRRFPVLAYGMRLKLDTVLTIIVATAVLQNIARELNETEPPLAEDVDGDYLNYLINLGNVPFVPAYDQNEIQDNGRNQLITEYFSNI